MPPFPFTALLLSGLGAGWLPVPWMAFPLQRPVASATQLHGAHKPMELLWLRCLPPWKARVVFLNTPWVSWGKAFLCCTLFMRTRPVALECLLLNVCVNGLS